MDYPRLMDSVLVGLATAGIVVATLPLSGVGDYKRMQKRERIWLFTFFILPPVSLFSDAVGHWMQRNTGQVPLTVQVLALGAMLGVFLLPAFIPASFFNRHGVVKVHGSFLHIRIVLFALGAFFGHLVYVWVTH